MNEIEYCKAVSRRLVLLLIDNLPDNLQFNCIIFIAHLASSKPTLGHFRRNHLTSNFNHFPLLQHQLKGHQEPQNMVGFLSSAQRNLMHRLNVLTAFSKFPRMISRINTPLEYFDFSEKNAIHHR